MRRNTPWWFMRSWYSHQPFPRCNLHHRCRRPCPWQRSGSWSRCKGCSCSAPHTGTCCVLDPHQMLRSSCTYMESNHVDKKHINLGAYYRDQPAGIATGTGSRAATEIVAASA